VNPTAEFPKMPDWQANEGGLIERLRSKAGEHVHALPASRIATALLGDAIAINMFMLGYAWQMGRVPVGFEALDRAIELNGVQIDFNRACFMWGRRMAINPAAVEKASGTGTMDDGSKVIEFAPRRLERVEDIVQDRSKRLEAYQNKALANRYSSMVEQAKVADTKLDAQGRLAKAVARYYYKLLAEKDEFEVARLYSEPAFRKGIDAQFEGDFKVTLNLGAWPFAKRDPATGELRKREVGRWIFPAMNVLQAVRGIRNSWLDPFRNSPERVLAHELLAQYEQDLQLIFGRAGQQVSAGDAVQLAALPEKIRGYGHVRRAHAAKVGPERDALRMKLVEPESVRRAA
jgi:indolepyruvate ferredoxin oxidoreductase